MECRLQEDFNGMSLCLTGGYDSPHIGGGIKALYCIRGGNGIPWINDFTLFALMGTVSLA